MAAVNSRRLGLPAPIWRPVAIGLGAAVLSALLEVILIESLLLDAALYLGALWMIWSFDLQAQAAVFDLHHHEHRQPAGFLIPCLAGSPAALIVVMNFLIVPLLPLQPREVCEKFIAASSLKEAKKHTTINLWPALDAFFAAAETESDDEFNFELTDEAEAQAPLKGYLVGYRMDTKSEGQYAVMEGFFHLVDFSGAWKIEEWYISSINKEELAEPIPMSTAYRQILPEQAPKVAEAPPATKGWIRSLVDWGTNSKDSSARFLRIIALLVVIGISRGLSRLTDSNTTEKAQ